MNTSKLALRGGWQRRPRRALASAAAIALGVSLASCSSGSHAGSTTTSTTTTSTTTTSTTTMSTSPTSTSPTSTTTTVPSSSLGSYLPLAPFAAYREVQAWQRSYLSGGHQPWHLDAGATALAFAAWLGFPQINKVVATRMDSTGAHVSIGFYVGGPSKETASSAVIHEVRWGNGSDAPWEVVGTDDKSFSLTAPAYGTTATSPVAVGGRISGVDENIAVEVRTSSSTSNIGTFCCRAAGGVNSPWSATVSFTAPSGSVLTIVARTGGHVATVEQFTVTGIRAG